MPKYRDNLPQLTGGTFLSDGGMETTLIFHEGMELPHFASCVLLDTEEGRQSLEAYYERYLAVARRHGAGFVLDSATWRANPDWAEKLGYGPAALRALNLKAIDLLVEIRDRWEAPATPIVINGAIGPRGDAYRPGAVGAEEAQRYHDAQIAAFAESEADMVSGYTLNSIEEAVGIARAAHSHRMPCMISFTVETDGRLIDGRTLQEAIEGVDRETDASPVSYMINCAHPAHFDAVLAEGGAWLKRIHGLRANASAKSHAELDESTTLDAGDPADLGQRYARLRQSMPSLRILGGCCGTDHRHVAAIGAACLPPMAKSA
jgi:homocysteine S-methyltransferase